ncbi:MAG TPA: TlpA disulfide reductase family protein [Acidimicrobiales bacterium]|nr:TlpA disulfide reductase family protein [Acidimicrobiales bacterium]
MRAELTLRRARTAAGTAHRDRPRVRHRARWIAAALLAVLVALSVVAATRPAVEATPFQSPLEGRQAPGFTATSLDGARVSLASYRGRVVVLNFFASWCPPCQQEMPDLVQFAFEQSRHQGGAALLSVVFQDRDAAARQFDDTWGTAWPTLADPGGSLAFDYGVTAPPTTFLIAPDGKVAGAFTGPLTAAQLTAAVHAVARGGR